MSRPVRTELPRWLSAASVVSVGAVLAALAVAIGAAFFWFEQRETEARELQSAELLARVIEDHANRTFNAIDITLATLADTVRANGRGLEPLQLGPTLTQAAYGLPFLRSISVLDATGRVLASSVEGNVGVVVDGQRVALPAGRLIDRLGGLVPGRDLADATEIAAPSSRTFLPLVRGVDNVPEQPLYLVAVLNPDFFANEYQLMLPDASRAAALLSSEGRLLSATDAIRMAPGRSAAAHRLFSEYLPSRESGSYIGVGLDGDRVVTAFRLLRRRPIAVLVERDYASVQRELARIAGWVSGACGAVLLVIGGMVAMAWRSLRSHAAVHGALARSRERVAASERDLRTLVESVHELVFRTDATGRITFVNGRWQQVSGHADAEVIGRRLADLCLEDDRPRIESRFDDSVMQAAEPAMVRIRTAGGEVRTLEVSVAAIRGDDRTLESFAGFAVDVSERQLARDKLQAQLDFTARLLQISPTPLFVKDREGRFMMINEAWLRLMGLTSVQVIGRESAELFGAAGPFHAEQDRRLLESEDPVRYENRLTRPDGEQRDTVVTKVRFTHADGSAAGIIGSIVDVTEFREAERSTREARDAAERANGAKSEFIANISHELRTPLQSIIGFSELGRDLASEHAEFQEMFSDIHAGGRRMLTLVNGLLDVSKMDSTLGSLTLLSCDVAGLARDVVKELRPIAARRGLVIDLQSSRASVVGDVDAFRMQQVLRNVLANALRFAPERSDIVMRIDDLGADGIEIGVRDHGPGIPPDELESIFDAFVQSSRTRDGSGGTGLGLTICRKIMGAHGGTIAAANADEGGAILRIRLPAGAAVQDAKATTTASAPSLPDRPDVPSAARTGRARAASVVAALAAPRVVDVDVGT